MSLLIECQRKLSDLQMQVSQMSKDVLTRAQKWRRLSAIPTTECDVVLTFKPGADRETVDWFTKILIDRVPQLVVQQKFHHMCGQYALYLTSSYRDLLDGAEELRIQKPLLAEYGAGLREFCVDDLDLFENVMTEKLFLSSIERCNIVYHFLMSLHAHRDDVWKGDPHKFAEGQSMVPILQSLSFIDQIFPLHDYNELNVLSGKWVRGWTFTQPLDQIKLYFGIKIALYFAWLGHYTFALLFPTVIGLLVWLVMDPKKNPSSYYLLMSIFIVIWAFLYLEHWKRTSTSLTYKWDTWDQPSTLLEEPRPMFKGKFTLCPITGRPIRTYPIWRRNIILCFVTGPIVIASLTIVIFITWGFVRLQEHTNQLTVYHDSPIFNSLLLSLPKILLALAVAVMDVSYQKMARWLTDLENHRLERDYYNHFVGKLILLQFMNSFYSLFYTAFYLNNLDLLKKQLVTLLVTRQLLGNVKEIFLPFGQSRLRQVWLSLRYEQRRQAEKQIPGQPFITTTSGLNASGNVQSESNEDTSLHRRAVDSKIASENSTSDSGNSDVSAPILAAEREATLLKYEDPMDDFLEMFIQFGYVSMFTCVFPLAGLFSFFNNLMEIRADAFKLTSTYQRPFAQPASNIGVWQLALELVSYVAVVVNLGLLGITGTIKQLFPYLSATQLLILIVVIEHLVFILRVAISFLIPKTPSVICEKIAKLEHRRREALKKLERDTMREHHRQRSSSSNFTKKI